MKLKLLGLLLFVSLIESIFGCCHFFSIRKTTYFKALRNCERLNLCLADMSTEISFEDLKTNLNATNRKEYWFGLNAVGLDSFRYISDKREAEYIPEFSKMEKPCGLLKPSSPDRYVIHTADCDTKKRYVCGPTKTCNGATLVKTNPDMRTCGLTPADMKILHDTGNQKRANPSAEKAVQTPWIQPGAQSGAASPNAEKAVQTPWIQPEAQSGAASPNAEKAVQTPWIQPEAQHGAASPNAEKAVQSPGIQPEAQPEPQPEAQPEPQPEAQPEPQPEAQPETEAPA